EADLSQRERLAALRASRDATQVQSSLDALRAAAKTSENLIPRILDCARVYCTLYEIRAAMEEVFGAYREPVFF
ncbi:MAG: methylmalonyl-CoA mutase family protein, partial [Gemmatimonadaceae bacterium]